MLAFEQEEKACVTPRAWINNISKLSFIQSYILYITYISIFFLHIWCALRLKEGTGSLRTGVRGACEPPRALNCWAIPPVKNELLLFRTQTTCPDPAVAQGKFTKCGSSYTIVLLTPLPVRQLSLERTCIEWDTGDSKGWLPDHHQLHRRSRGRCHVGIPTSSMSLIELIFFFQFWY